MGRISNRNIKEEEVRCLDQKKRTGRVWKAEIEGEVIILKEEIREKEIWRIKKGEIRIKKSEIIKIKISLYQS